MVYCVYSLESPRGGDADENTQHTFMLKKIKTISILSLLTWRCNRTLIGSNYPCLEQIFMVPKVFEPMKFDCIIEKWLVCLWYIGTQYPRMIGHFNLKTFFVKTKFKTRSTMNGVIS